LSLPEFRDWNQLLPAALHETLVTAENAHPATVLKTNLGNAPPQATLPPSRLLDKQDFDSSPQAITP